jgi:hypothetical protein
MAADSTAICNHALMKMGQDLIDSISGTDVLEQKCNLIYTGGSFADVDTTA